MIFLIFLRLTPILFVFFKMLPLTKLNIFDLILNKPPDVSLIYLNLWAILLLVLTSDPLSDLLTHLLVFIVLVLFVDRRYSLRVAHGRLLVVLSRSWHFFSEASDGNPKRQVVDRHYIPKAKQEGAVVCKVSELLVIVHASFEQSFIETKVNQVPNQNAHQEHRWEKFISSNVKLFESLLCLLYLSLRRPERNCESQSQVSYGNHVSD